MDYQQGKRRSISAPLVRLRGADDRDRAARAIAGRVTALHLGAAGREWPRPPGRIDPPRSRRSGFGPWLRPAHATPGADRHVFAPAIRTVIDDRAAGHNTRG